MTMFKAGGDKINVCPYKFVECKLKDQNKCTIIQAAREVGDVKVWSRITYQADKCPHVGDMLTKAEYYNRCRGKVVKLL